jgi:uncharacterized membrane protein YccC
MMAPQRFISLGAKVLILLGLFVLCLILVGWTPSGTGLLLPLVAFVLLAGGFILLKKPEYLVFSLTWP